MSIDVTMLLSILAAALVTGLIRAVPYLLFGGRDTLPGTISYLGGVLPPAIMMALVVYCLRNTAFHSWPFGIPELATLALTILLQAWKKNTIVTIVLATALYMVLIRVM